MVKRRTIPLLDAYNVFLVDRKASGFTAPTLAFYRQKLGVFVKWADAQGAVALSDVTPALIRAYLVHLRDGGLADATCNGAGRAIRAFFNFALREGMLATSPAAVVTFPKPPKQIPPALTGEDVEKLLTVAPDPRARALVLFLLDTGVRVQECANLNGGDVNLKDGEVRVRRGKGRKDRSTYIGAKTRRALIGYFHADGWPEPAEPLWRNERTGGRLTHSGIRQILADLGREAHVKPCSPHTFRRTFALWSLRAGMNIYVLARLMGHADIQVLRQYLALAEGDLRAAHEQAAPVDRLLK